MKADGGEAVGFVGPAIRGHWGQATNQVAAITLSVIIAFWTKNVRGGNTIAMRNIRPVSPSDLELICRHRHEMFREAGRTEADLAPMAGPFRRWLAKRLEDGAYFGFVAENAGRAIGAVGLMAIDWPPHPAHPLDDGRGVAHALMTASDREFARRGLQYLILHATEAGRPLYERSGWVRTTEMAKT